jgi:HemY protein
MRTAIWFVLLFAAAVVAATTLGTNDGLVSLYWREWKVDLSLNLFLLGLLGTCFALVTVIQAINTLVGLPRRAREWRVSRRERSAQAALREALAQYLGGRYSRAQKSAQRALAIQADTPELAQDNDFTVLGHLLAAGSMHRLQDRAHRDEQLQLALDLARRNPAARQAEEGARLLAAEWALDDRDAARALELLAQLPPGVSRRTHALRLKLQAARLSNQPQEALKTARLLAKHQGFSRGAAQGLLRALAFEALDTARDPDQVRRAWQQLDASDRKDPVVAGRAATRMANLGAPDEARAWLRPFWEQLGTLSADDRAALAMALVASIKGIGVEWLPQLEGAVHAHPREPALAYAVGAAFVERQIFGKARALLEQAAADPALNAMARRHCWLLLASLADREGDSARAVQSYERAARVA